MSTEVIRLARTPAESLTPAERHRLWAEWNDTPAVFPPAHCLHQLFEEQAQRTPEAVAVELGETRLTYQELNQRANQLAHHLCRRGVGPEVLVGLCVERGIEMAVGLLGILKAGGAYVPLDPHYPKERLAFILEDTRCPVLLTQRRFAEKFSAAGATDQPSRNERSADSFVRGSGATAEQRADKAVRAPGKFSSATESPHLICLDGDGDALAENSSENPQSEATPQNLAYVIHTSGSTGQPKGVLVPHQAVVNHATAMARQVGLRSDDRVLQFASLSFDLAGEELYPAWFCGATVVLRPPGLPTSSAEFLQFLEQQRVTVLDLVTSYWGELVSELERHEWPACVRLVIVGGETALRETYLTWRRRVGAGVKWFNTYGPTEATITATIFEPTDKLPETASVPIGRPIANVQAYVLDEQLRSVPVGTPGELYLGGAGLARGYLNAPQLTAAKFVPHPFSAEPQARLYKTGDRVRSWPDGTLEFLGRNDEQIKLRGYRIEPAEIEAVLAAHPLVKQSVVVTCEHPQRRLVAYVVLAQTAADAPPIPALRAHLQTALPEYMVPSRFVILDTLPMMPNGKVDRRALPAPEPDRPELAAAFVAPRTPVEERLAEIWREVLGVAQVGVHDNFFDLGGHSLLAMQIVSRLRQSFPVALPLRGLFETPTVAGLAETVAASLGTPPEPILPASRDSPLPLSFAQERLWFFDQLESGGHAYNMADTLRISGALNIPALAQSLSEVVRRHEVLRTTFATVEGRGVQIIAPPRPVPVPEVDLRSLSESAREAETRRLLAEQARRPFDLAADLMLRATLLRLGESEFLLLLVSHHIASDAWSVGLLYDELASLYSSFSAGGAVALPELPLQYADFGVWQRQRMTGEVLEKELAYWKRQLHGGPPVLDLPTDRPRPDVQSYAGASQSIVLPRKLWEALGSLSRQENATPFMTVLAAFQTLLHRYTGQRDIVVGSPIAGRNRLETEPLLGFFVNTLVLRTKFSGEPTFREVLRRVRETALGAYAHQELPFEKLVEALQPERDPGSSPLFQVMLALENELTPIIPGLKLCAQEVHTGTALFDLTLTVVEGAQATRATLTYNTDLFEAATGTRLLNHFQNLLEGLVADPDERVGRLRLLSAAEEEELLALSCRHGRQVRDEHGQLVPMGVVGEVWVSARGLAHSKTLREDDAPGKSEGFGVRQSSGAFIRAKDEGARLHEGNTGCLGRWRADGTLEVLGWLERQTWIGGRRVDLDEVESALRSDPTVADCAVLARPGENASTHIVAYIVPNVAFSESQLQVRLQTILPTWKRPSVYVPVAALPLTPEGAIDEAALCRLEVLDEDLRRRWEEQLRAAPGVEQVAVGIRPKVQPRRAWHLADLLPEWKEAVQGASARNNSENSASEPTCQSGSKLHALQTLRVTAAPRKSRSVWSAPGLPALSAQGSSERNLSAPASRVQAESLKTGLRPLAIADGGPLLLPDDEPVVLADVLRRAAEQGRGLVFLHADGSELRLSYDELLNEAQRLLGGLRRLRVKPGEKVIFQFARERDFIVAFWSCMFGGFIPVPWAVPPAYDSDNSVAQKLQQAWEVLRRPLVLTDRTGTAALQKWLSSRGVDPIRLACLEELRDAAPDTNGHPAQPEDVALLMPTSGSTGQAKFVPLSHRNVLSRSAGSKQRNGFSPCDIDLNWLPLDHVVGLVYSHVRDVYLGCQQIQAATSLVLQDPLRWLDWMERYRATMTWAPNFAYALINEQEITRRKWDLSSLRFILNGAEPIVARTVWRFLKRLEPHGLAAGVMRPAWGMAETSSGVVYSDRFAATSEDDPFVEVGPPIPGVSLRIVDDQNQVVLEETVGRLQVRGLPVTSGYHEDPALNREMFTNDGWLDTGDLGYLREGRLTVTGRRKDVIIINGLNYYSHEIESVVEQVAGVRATWTAACAVRGTTDATDSLAIFFSPVGAEENVTALLQEIRLQVLRRVGVNPAHLIPMAPENIPKTAAGKIQRSLLKVRFERDEFAEVRKRVDLLSHNANTLSDWFYRMRWRRKELRHASSTAGIAPPHPSPLPPVGRGGEGEEPPTSSASPLNAERAEVKRATMAFVDGAGWEAALGQTLILVEPGEAFAKLSGTRYRIHPADPEHYHRLLRHLAEDRLQAEHIVHLWTCSNAPSPPSSVEQIERAQDRGLFSVLFLTQALAQARRTSDTPHASSLTLLVASSGAHAVSENSPVRFEHTPLLGLLKSISQEMPWLRCRHVDLPVAAAKVNAARLVAELQSNHADVEVAYRDGQRLVASLERIDFESAGRQPLPFARGGMYLITGGLGGIGQYVAKYLLEHFAAKLLLVGRRAVADHADSLQALVSLGGEVIYESVDVGDLRRMQEVVARAQTRWHCQLAGVIHLAGVAVERPLLEETRQSVTEVLHPKVAAWTLHELIKDRPQALFLCFSSVNAFFGGTHFGAYAAANRFLEGLVEYRRQNGFAKSFCIHWSLWDQVGMGRRYGQRDLAGQRGFAAVTAEQGMMSLRAALLRDEASVFVGLDGSNPYICRHTTPQQFAAQELCAFVPRRCQEAVGQAGRALELRDRFGTPATCQLAPMAELPLTPAGEIDRAKLGVPERGPSVNGAAPETRVERRLAALWQELLGVPRVSREDNFFSLGGHSLLATQLVSRVRQNLGVELPLQTLFQSPTLRGLAQCLERASPRASPLDRGPIKSVARQGEFPLSFAQERLWFFDQLMPGSGFYNVPTLLRVTGPLDVPALEESFNEIIRRHETLRTTFCVLNEVPMQVVAQSLCFKPTLSDLRAVPAREREARACELALAEGQKAFDLAKGPLLRASVLRLEEDEYLLALTLHHIISDGWSQGILIGELAALYETFISGRPASLPELRIQYADYAQWQRQWLQDRVLEEQLGYWKEQLGQNLPVLELPTDRPRPALQSFRGALHSFLLPAALQEQLKALSQREGVTLFMTLLAAFKSLLARHATQEDIVVGTPIANRNRVETEGLIGFLANTLVLRSDLSGDPTFRELLQRVQKVALGAYAHQDLPFEKLVEALNPERDLSRHPLFQVMFVLQNAPMPEMKLAGLALRPVEVDIGTALFDLTLYLEETSGGLKGTLEFNSDLFDAETMRRLAGHYQTLLEAIVANPDQRIRQLPLLSATERRQLLVDWNQTKTDYPREKCIHQLFEEQAARSPHAVAVVLGEQQLTYRELNERANQLAHHLRKLGAGPEGLVGLCLERSLEMVVGLLGILKAGGAYLPLDISYPKERLAFMLADARAPLLVTQQRWLSGWAERPAKVVCIDAERDLISRQSTQNLTSDLTPQALAYVMFTSGSSGSPKGVSIEHRGVVRLVRNTNYVQLGPEEVILQLAPLSFDASTFEIWGALLNGGRLVLMPPGAPSLDDIRVALQWHKVTTLWLTADLFHLMVEERLEDVTTVRQLLAGGDVLSVTHVNRVLAARGKQKLINGYGPTESTTFACCHVMEGSAPVERTVPIGRPIANTQVYLLDAFLQPVAIGVAGEVWLGGDGLARGYWNRPELTAERFVRNPFSETPGERLYRTGDLARYRSDGTIEFLGRRDRQVKVRGFRIELAEVEAGLKQHPNVRQAVASLCDEPPKRLVAYVVPHHAPAPTLNELRDFLKQRLPEYMVPSSFAALETLPLTPSGKVDVPALTRTCGVSPPALGSAVAPQDLLEVQLKQLWERVLGRRTVGVRDNFFDLGGHSLLAVRLFSQVEKMTGRPLPLATLFQAPTVEQLARVLRQDGWTLPWSSLVPIQAGGTRPPFFIIHGLGGNVLNFYGLARYLGEDQPVYGLQSRGLDGKSPPITRIAEMAAHYIKEIKTIQREGPYRLGGMSFGGVVAYEMAQQLHARGEQVSVLALLDSYALGHSELIALTERCRHEMDLLARRVKMHWKNLLSFPAKERLRYVRSKGHTLRRKIKSLLWQMVYKMYSRSGRPLPTALQNVKEANFLAAKDYVTQPYPGRVMLFLASEQTVEGDQHEVWSKLALGGVELHKIPGDHVTLIEEPNVRVLAEQLAVCLNGN